MTKPAELDREIRAYLAQSAEERDDSSMNFDDLIRHDDPGSMRAAEQLLRRRGWKLREVTGALRARNFTISINPLHGPRDEWKMVQVSVAPTELSSTRKRGKSGMGIKRGPGWIWVRLHAANGPIRVERTREFRGNIDDARKLAVANAWNIAKALKSLPLSASEASVAEIVDRYFGRRTVDKSIADIL